MHITRGGGNMKAPALRVADFCINKISSNLPHCSYHPGIVPSGFDEVLPGFVNASLIEGLKIFNKKLKGFISSEAIVVATESRTSSPVKVPRDSLYYNHPSIQNLYPCGEGCGYAGGIISAAIDGRNVVKAILKQS